MNGFATVRTLQISLSNLSNSSLFAGFRLSFCFVCVSDSAAHFLCEKVASLVGGLMLYGSAASLPRIREHPVLT